ncbi:hypothetical protein TWF481_011875 [Arthrobotrys musiformis]|uniref:Uncharacterized protein n=1 Tax=Arthrobotrys musiformis TaxID=47236 RepID=A0AAV9VWX2_9PEZI
MIGEEVGGRVVFRTLTLICRVYQDYQLYQDYQDYQVYLPLMMKLFRGGAEEDGGEDEGNGKGEGEGGPGGEGRRRRVGGKGRIPGFELKSPRLPDGVLELPHGDSEISGGEPLRDANDPTESG